MKKLIALIAVCGFAFAFVACGAKKEPEATAADSTSVVEEPAPAADTTVVTDSTDSASVAPAH